jgi:hypothetical protein
MGMSPSCYAARCPVSNSFPTFNVTTMFLETLHMKCIGLDVLRRNEFIKPMFYIMYLMK